MKYIDRTVNADGIAAIHKFLSEKHKKGGDHFTPDMLRAWARSADFQMEQGNTPTIEVRSWDSMSGHTVTFTVPDEGIDSREVEVEE